MNISNCPEAFCKYAPQRVLSFEFMPEHLETAASILSVIKLQFLQILCIPQFSPRPLVPYLTFRSLLFFYHSELEIIELFMQAILLLTNIMVSFFYRQINPFNFVSKVFFHYLACD